jgi:hypothetical protein
MTINADVKGELRVAMLNADGSEIPGFGFADCVAMTGNALEHPVAWSGGRDLSSLKGHVIAIGISVREGKLYGFEIKDQKP